MYKLFLLAIILSSCSSIRKLDTYSYTMEHYSAPFYRQIDDFKEEILYLNQRDNEVIISTIVATDFIYNDQEEIIDTVIEQSTILNQYSVKTINKNAFQYVGASFDTLSFSYIGDTSIMQERPFCQPITFRAYQMKSAEYFEQHGKFTFVFRGEELIKLNGCNRLVKALKFHVYDDIVEFNDFKPDIVFIDRNTGIPLQWSYLMPVGSIGEEIFWRMYRISL